MQNQLKDSFTSDTKKNPKDCMEITLRSGRELLKRKEDEKMMTEKENQAKTEEETKLDSSKMIEERRKLKVQQEQPVEKVDLKKKDEVQAYKPHIPFP